ncbi:MAG: TlpA family protein disulfide reductase [Pirellula sp.]|nr:TlpA family protein disulfide reductase [Pirellula sp.]
MKSFFRRVAVRTALLSAFCFSGFGISHAHGEDLLSIGSDAPALDVEHWVQNGGGKFGKVTKFEKDKVYVVEFWATWCGPCIMSMPHIVDTQKKYAGKGVQIVSISDEPLETVEEFLERELPPSIPVEGEATKTFRDLTKSYCLTTDPDGSSGKDYMEAARQNGIPCAFIVGKDAKIEWIGHPMEMDEPLDMVVNNKWDREKFAAEFKEQQEQQALMQEAQIAVGGLLRKKKFPEALAKLDEFIERAKGSTMKLNLLMTKINLHQIAESDAAAINATFSEVFKIAGEDPMMANQVAWTVWEMSEQGKVEGEDVLKSARDLAKKASEKQQGNMKAMTLDTVSHLEYALGNVKEALKIQEEAMSLADAQGKENLQEFLEQLKAELDKSKK